MPIFSIKSREQCPCAVAAVNPGKHRFRKNAQPKPATSQATPQPAQPAPQPEPDKRTEAAPAAPVATESSAEPVAAPAVVPASYTVKAGQSLWSIANEALGDGNRYLEILDLNPALRGNPARIRAGQELVLPAGQ